MENKEVFYWKRWYRNNIFKLRFRVDPIPYTGKTSGLRNYYRKVKTYQEIKRNSYEKEFSRGRRYVSNLPTSWDDIVKSKEQIRGWKRSKKVKQWMRMRSSCCRKRFQIIKKFHLNESD